MKFLYVLGNGFDLWHKLPTHFSDFYRFTDGSLDELGEYFSFKYTNDSLWTDFESELGSFDWELFYEAHYHIDVSSDSFRPSEAFCLEDDITEQADHLVEGVREQFREWVESIPVDEANASFSIVNESRCISFNYTSLLQDLYGVEDSHILHIHGSIKQYNELVFGHGESREEEKELDDEGNSNRTMFSDAEGAAKSPFYAFQKPVSDILDNNREYFDALSNIDVVVVLGHSLNDIDIPYFKRIAEVSNCKKWVVSKHSENDEALYTYQLGKCGVIPEYIIFCPMKDIPKALNAVEN